MKIEVIKHNEKMEVMNIKRKRVAAYARVSTFSFEQEDSFESQVNYYSKMINGNPDFEFVEVYADQGTSATQVMTRPNFMRMIKDAMDGKIDIIYCKSISRFCRNAAQCQEIIRALKDKLVEVIFEKEQLSSFNPMSEMVFNFMTVIAQEESRSISENTIWALDRQAEQGIRKLGNANAPFGYCEIDGILTPNNNAHIIKYIFENYANGMQTYEIAKNLKVMGVVRKRMKDAFKARDILKIIHNEVYKGDRILQKGPHQNYLTHKPDFTREYNTYYVNEAHEPIVSKELWEKCKTQRRINKEKHLFTFRVSPYEYDGTKIVIKKRSHKLYGKVICGDCGDYYERQLAKYKDEKFYVWQCRGRRNKNGCNNHRIKESKILNQIDAIDEVKEILVNHNHTITISYNE